MPHHLKKRFYDVYDVGGTQCQVDIRGIWDSDQGARAAAAPGFSLFSQHFNHVMLHVLQFGFNSQSWEATRW